MEAGAGESRRQAALLRHSPSTMVLRQAAVLLTVIALLVPCCSTQPPIVRLPSTVCEQVYSESVIPRIAKAASGVTGTPYNELMNSWGVYFLGFVGKYGYDRILKVKERKNISETVDAHFLCMTYVKGILECFGIFFFFLSLDILFIMPF